MLDEGLEEGDTIPDDDGPDDNPATNAEASVTVAPSAPVDDDDDPDDTKATASRNSSDNIDDDDAPTVRAEPTDLTPATAPATAPVSDLPPSVTAIIQAALATDRPVTLNIYLNGK